MELRVVGGVRMELRVVGGRVWRWEGGKGGRGLRRWEGGKVGGVEVEGGEGGRGRRWEGVRWWDWRVLGLERKG